MKLKVNGGWWQFSQPLKDLEPFTTHGALYGRPGNAYGIAVGRLDSKYHESVKHADYVVYSYATPIAWHLPAGSPTEAYPDGVWYAMNPHGEWITPEDKYSVTTSKHQGRIYTAISELRKEVIIEYRVWCENGDLVIHTYDESAAEAALAKAIAECPCEEGEDCGVFYPHGYHIQEVEYHYS
jgi:hypothetical protein